MKGPRRKRKSTMSSECGMGELFVSTCVAQTFCINRIEEALSCLADLSVICGRGSEVKLRPPAGNMRDCPGEGQPHKGLKMSPHT